MSVVWAVIVSVIVAMILYGIISSRIREKQRSAKREDTLRKVDGGIKAGGRYHFQLSDGTRLAGMELVGSLPPEAAEAYGWGDMLVLADADGKKLYVRRSAVRWVKEI